MATAFLIRLDNLNENSKVALHAGVVFVKIFHADDINYLAIEFSAPKQNSVLTFINEEYGLSGTLITLKNPLRYLESQEELFISKIPPVLSADKLDAFILNFIQNEKIFISKRSCYYSIKSKNEQNRKRLHLFLPSIPFKSGNMIASFSCLDFPILRFSNFPKEVDIEQFIKESLQDVKILDIMESSPKRLQKVKYANVLFESSDILPTIIEQFNLKQVNDKTIYVNRFIEPSMKESIQKNEVRVNFLSTTDTKTFYQEMYQFGDIYRIGPMINDETGFAGYVTFCHKESAEALIKSSDFSTSYSMVYLLVCNFPPETNCAEVKDFLTQVCLDNLSKDPIESVIQYQNQESNLTLPSFIVKIKDEYHYLMDEIIKQLSVNPYETAQPYGLYWSPHEGDNKFDDKEIIPRLFDNDYNMIAIFPIKPESVNGFFKKCSDYGIISFYQSCSHTDPPLLIVRYEDESQCKMAMEEINSSFFCGNQLTVRTFSLKNSFDEIIAGQESPPKPSRNQKKAQKKKTEENKQKMEDSKKERKKKKEKEPRYKIIDPYYQYAYIPWGQYPCQCPMPCDYFQPFDRYWIHPPYFNPPMHPIKVCRPSSISYRKMPKPFLLPSKLPPRSLSPQREMISPFSQNYVLPENNENPNLVPTTVNMNDDPPNLVRKKVKKNDEPPIRIDVRMDQPDFAQSKQLQSNIEPSAPQNGIRKKPNKTVKFQPQDEYRRDGSKADIDVPRGGKGGNRADFDIWRGGWRGGRGGNRADFDIWRGGRGGRGGFRCCSRGSQICTQNRRMVNHEPEQPHVFQDLSVRYQQPPGINCFNGQSRTLNDDPNFLSFNQMSGHPNGQVEQRNQNQRRETSNNLYFAGPSRTLNDDNPPNQRSNRINYDKNQNKGKGNHQHHHGHRK